MGRRITSSSALLGLQHKVGERTPPADGVGAVLGRGLTGWKTLSWQRCRQH